MDFLGDLYGRMNFLLQRYISLPIYRSCYDLHDIPSPRFLLRYAHSDVCRQFLLSVPVSIPVSSLLPSLFPPPTIFWHKKGRHHGGFPCVYLYLTTSLGWWVPIAICFVVFPLKVLKNLNFSSSHPAGISSDDSFFRPKWGLWIVYHAFIGRIREFFSRNCE